MRNGLLCWFYAKSIDFSGFFTSYASFSFSSRKFAVKLGSKSPKDVYFHFPATSDCDFATLISTGNRDTPEYFFAFGIAKNMKAKVLCTKSIFEVFRDMAERKFGEARRDWHSIAASAFDLIANWRFNVWRHRFSPLETIEPRLTPAVNCTLST